MTGAEAKKAMLRGVDRFRHIKTGREYAVDPAQAVMLNGDAPDDVVLIGYPIAENPRKRGRKWSWIAVKNLEISTKPCS